MKTFAELNALYKADLEIIAKSLGIAYTTKADTITAILEAQEQQGNASESAPESTPEELITPETTQTLVEPIVEPLLEAPVLDLGKGKGRKRKVEDLYPTEHFKRIGLVLGSDGNKKRYRLNGTPIN